MEFVLETQLNPRAECLFLLSRHCNQMPDVPNSIFAGVHWYCELHNIPDNVVAPMVDPLAQIEAEVLQGLPELGSAERLLFQSHEDFWTNLAWGFSFLEERGVELAQLAEGERREIVRQLLLLVLNHQIPDLDKVEDLPTLIQLLNEQGISTEVSWACVTVWRDPVEYQRKFRQIIRETETQLAGKQQALSAMLEKYLPDVQSTLKKVKTTGGILNEIPAYIQKITVYPSAMLFGQVLLVWNREMLGEHAYLFVSLHYWALDRLTAQYSDNSKLLANQAKTMADVRRVELLKALRGKPLCNQELVELLGYSQANVSYHMTYLQQEKFVKVEKRGSRIEYSLNRESMQAFVELIQATFLQQPRSGQG